MKRSLAFLLTALLILGSLIFTSCGEQDQSSDPAESEESCPYEFLDVKKYDKELHFTDEGSVCIIPDGASGDLKIPDSAEDSPVVAVVGKTAHNNDITSLTFGENVRHIEGLGEMKNLQSLTLPEGITDIHSSFNSCGQLTEVDFPQTLTAVTGSFNGCGRLETVSFKDNVESIEDSFESCASLKNVKYGSDPDDTVFDYFCSIGIFKDNKTLLDEALKETDDKVENASEHLNSQKDQFEKLFDTALQKLVDSGAIPEPEDGPITLQFDKKGSESYDRCDTVTFNDSKAMDRLFAYPDFPLEKAISSTQSRVDGDTKIGWYQASFCMDKKECGEALKNLNSGKAVYDPALDFDDCKYVIYHRKYYSYIAKNYYKLTDPDIEGGSTSIDRYDITNVIFIVDADKEEIVHIRSTDTAVPSDSYTYGQDNLLGGSGTSKINQAKKEGFVSSDNVSDGDGYIVRMIFGIPEEDDLN